MTSPVQSHAAAGILLICLAAPVSAFTRLPTPPLADRVRNARVVFVGTVVNRIEKGEWVQAELRVDEGIRNTRKDELVPVIWRKTVGGVAIYDAEEGQRGVAILDHQHQGRYWLRVDKFEPLTNAKAIKSMVSNAADSAAIPSFEDWVAQGKPLPSGRMFTGGSPWFNEATGERRSAEEVYKMLYGEDRMKRGISRTVNGLPE